MNKPIIKTLLYPFDFPITQITPKLLALLAKDNISRAELSKRLKMPIKLINTMLDNPNFNYSWFLLSKILYALGYSINGLTINKLGEKPKT